MNTDFPSAGDRGQPCPQRGCGQTDGKPCAYAQCPNRARRTLHMAERVINQAEPGTREGAMVVLETDAAGRPTIWCDPEIADLVRALNEGGLRTVASCSGHGESPFGIVTLADGRELLVMPDFETTRKAECILGSTLSAQPPVGASEVVAAIQRDLDDHGVAEIRQAELAALTRAAPSGGEVVAYTCGHVGSALWTITPDQYATLSECGAGEGFRPLIYGDVFLPSVDSVIAATRAAANLGWDIPHYIAVAMLTAAQQEGAP